MNKQLHRIFDKLVSEYSDKNITRTQVYYAIFMIKKVNVIAADEIYPKVFFQASLNGGGNKIILNYTSDTYCEPVIEIWDPVEESGMFVHISTKRIIALFEHVDDSSIKKFVGYL